MITVEYKTNGCKAEGLQEMIRRFEKVAEMLFPGCTIRHFYYGDHLDFADIILRPGDYGSFNITANRVSFNSHCGYPDEIRKYESMTYNDELFGGKLMELAEKEERTEMKIWVVYLDGEPEYGSTDWYDVHNRYVDLLNGFGEDRVEMKMEVRE